MDQLYFVLATDAPVDSMARQVVAGLNRCHHIPLDADAFASNGHAAIVIDGEYDPVRGLLFCRTLRAKFGGDCPQLIFLAANGQAARQDGYDHGADVCLSSPFGESELIAIADASARRFADRCKLREQAASAQQINQQLQQAYLRINGDVDLACRLQASLAPTQLPEVGRARFAVASQSSGTVRSDFYDVRRLDETHVAFFLADAMGHDVSAAFLAVFLRTALQGKVVTLDGYRILSPDEVLSRLNRDLIEQDLPEQPFATLVYGVIDTSNGDVMIARAAQPNPIVLPAHGQPEIWKLTGTLIGVSEAAYSVQTRTLQSGDKVVLFTDGLNQEGADPTASDVNPVLDAANAFRELPCQEFAESCHRRTLTGRTLNDDFTLLAVEML